MNLPIKYDEVIKKLNNYIHVVKYDPKAHDPIAFCYINKNALAGSHYKIVVNNENEELGKYCLMHEAGHIIFRHVSPITNMDYAVLKNKIRLVYDKIKSYFEDANVKDIYNYFSSYVFNIITDWEVNSKLFSKEEYDHFEQLYRDYEGNQTIKLCYPTDNDYPVGLSANEYLTMILIDPEKFLKKMEKQENQDSDDGGNGNSGNNQSNSKSKSGKNNSSKKDKSQSSSDGKNEKTAKQKFIDKIIGDAEKEIEKQNKIQEDSKGNDYSRDSSDSLNNLIDNVSSWSEYDSLAKKIYNILISRNNILSKRDVMHYYNRRKYNSNVCIPKTKQEIKHESSSMTVILDVSGSIDDSDILGFCNVFKKVANDLSKKCEIILWNTGMVGDYYSNQEIHAQGGGGTDIAKGIKYVANKKLTDSILFIVSDFQDDLDGWCNIYKGEMYGVCWEKLKDITENLRDVSPKDFFKMFNKILTKD